MAMRKPTTEKRPVQAGRVQTLEARANNELRFPSRVRSKIAQGFSENLLSSVPHDECARDAELFTTILEGIADGHIKLKAVGPDKHSIRVRRIKKFATSLGKLQESLSEIDNDAKAWLLYRLQVSIEGETVAQNVSPFARIEFAKTRAAATNMVLAEFRKAANATARTLPKNGFRANFLTARSLELQFRHFGLKFVEHRSGFAALCLKAIFEAAGDRLESPDYYLRGVQQKSRQVL